MTEIYKPTPEEMKKRSITDAELLNRGAEYESSGRLLVTKEQRERAKADMGPKLLARDLLKDFSEPEIRLIIEGLDSLNTVGTNKNPLKHDLMRRIEEAEQEAIKMIRDQETSAERTAGEQRPGDNIEDPGDQSRENQE